MSRNQEFHDAAGRKYVETDMPKSYQYKHKLSSFGQPRRLSVYDPNDPTPRKIKRGYVSDVKEGERGKKGLVGYVDFYREPREIVGTSIHTDEHGNQTKQPIEAKPNTNIGFMTVHDKHRGGGISTQMAEYLNKTTPEDARLNFGEVHHIGIAKIAAKMERENPSGRIHAKGLWYFKDQL